MPGFYVAERAAGSGLAQSVTPFPTESDWAGTGKAGSPTPRTASGQGAAPHRVTQEYISTLLFLTFQISPTGLFCQHHTGHGEVPFLPSCTIYSSTPKCHSAPIPWEPSWSQQNLRSTPAENFQKENIKGPGRQRTFPRSYKYICHSAPSPRVQEGKGNIWKAYHPSFLLAPRLRFCLPTEQQPWAKLITSLINSNMKVSICQKSQSFT